MDHGKSYMMSLNQFITQFLWTLGGVSQQRFRTLLWSLLIFRFAWALSSSQGSLGGFSSPQQINRLGQQISQDFYTLGWAYEFSCFFSVDTTVICGRLPYATL